MEKSDLDYPEQKELKYYVVYLLNSERYVGKIEESKIAVSWYGVYWYDTYRYVGACIGYYLIYALRLD